MKTNVKKLTYAAMFLAMAYVLPFVTGHIPEIGKMLCPMHIPVLLCGFVCGWQWGMGVGFIAPIMRSLILNMPTPFYPNAVGMAFELAAYGLAAGIMYRLLPKKLPYIYVDLVVSMIVGRLVWGAARLVMAGLDVSKFGLALFWAGGFVNAFPGIIVQLAIIPAIVSALGHAGLVLNKDEKKDRTADAD